MATIAFAELVESLPRGDGLRPRKVPTGLSYVETANPCFVAPDLHVEQPPERGRTSVVLLSAPGAVGKSTLAAELAHGTGSLLWDLSRFQVGSRTFSGTLLDAYDMMATGVLKRLREGSFLFVLDALDEAQIRAGAQNFDAFLSDLAEALRDPRARPVIALLARTDTADWIQLFFEESRVPVARYQIEYFDSRRSFSFIDQRLDGLRSRDGQQPLHRQQQKPYTQARGALFELIYRLFGISESEAWRDDRVKNFLGYAPVLETLTDYLDVSNYMPLIRELEGGTGAARDPWQFFADILERLLRREQSKVKTAVQANLEHAAKAASWSDWGSVYEPEEQCSRVLAHSLGVAPELGMVCLPVPLAELYERALKTQLPQHPFLSGKRFANVVFREYAYAWGALRGRHLAENLRETLRNREEPFLPSQLYSRFVESLAVGGVPVLDGQDFGVLYESLLSRSPAALLTVLRGGDALHASVMLDPDGGTEVEYHLSDSGSGVLFSRRLARADIDATCAVRLGLPGQRFLLGPSVVVNCSDFAVACDDLDVDVRENVSIRSSSYTTSSVGLILRLRNEASGRLAVSWPDLGHPWAPYRAAETKTPLRLGETLRGDTLRKFILMFRRQRSRMTATLRGTRWSQDQLGERDRLLDLALRRGVLSRVDVRDALAFNSDYDSLMTLVAGEPTLSPRARAFIDEYLGKEEARRVLAS